MASLGKFGVKRERVPDPTPPSFDWFGVEIRVTPFAINQVELIDLMETVQQVDEDDPRSMTIVKDLFRQVLHVDDFDQFWATAREEAQELEDLMPLYQTLMVELTSRPTKQPSDYLPGRLATQESSPVVSSLAERRGRPDIQMIHDDSAAIRERAQAAARAAAMGG